MPKLTKRVMHRWSNAYSLPVLFRVNPSLKALPRNKSARKQHSILSENLGQRQASVAVGVTRGIEVPAILSVTTHRLQMSLLTSKSTLVKAWTVFVSHVDVFVTASDVLLCSSVWIISFHATIVEAKIAKGYHCYYLVWYAHSEMGRTSSKCVTYKSNCQWLKASSMRDSRRCENFQVTDRQTRSCFSTKMSWLREDDF